MNEKYTAKHSENAVDLYDLRLSWLNETDIHASAFESVEERLSVSINHIGRTLGSNDPENDTSQTEKKKEPSKEAECFTLLASHISSPQPLISAAGYDLTCQWLTLDAAKSAAAETALSLYPDDDPAKLLKLYDEQETLRPSLFRIFRKQILALPLAMVNTAATAESSTSALKIEALQYAAECADIGLDIFRTHYLPLLSGRTHFDAGIVEAAIWGGMVRSDADATKAISAALSHAGSATDHAKLMRLAALTGNPDFLPLLLMAAENDPGTGYPLLVLFGQKSVIPELLNAMEFAQTIEQAAKAFGLLTDQNLPRVPRLTVVGEETDDVEEDAPQTPDIKVARAWWDKHQATWKAEERWLYGKPATTSHLIAMSKKHAGSFGRDVMALLALAQKVPLNIPSEIWRARQMQLYNDLKTDHRKAA